MSPGAALLADVCDISMGQAPSGDTYNTEGKGLPLIAGAGDFGDLTPKPTKFTTSPTKISRSGDLILCIRATIGDRNWSDGEYCLGRGVAGLSARPHKLDQKYLWHWLGYATPKLKAKGRGATFLQVNKADIGSMEVPLPPLDEQRRIAAILDKADALRAKRRETIAKLDQLMQSVFLDMFGDPLNNPKQLPIRPLGTICREVYRYPTYYGIEYESQGVAEVRGEMITADGVIDSSKARYISSATSRRFPRTQLCAGDLVMSVRGTVGKVGFVSDDLAGANMTANLMRISPDPAKVDPIYLWRFAMTDYFARYLERVSSSTTIKTIKAPDLKALPVILPAVIDQKKFQEVHYRLITLSEKAAQSSSAVESLFASLQHRAFSGTL